MQRATNFHRSILVKEWEHRKLRMEIEDLQDHLRNLKSMKVDTIPLGSITINIHRAIKYVCVSPMSIRTTQSQEHIDPHQWFHGG
jgi:hypothetical protein